jgi:hypothetical protein
MKVDYKPHCFGQWDNSEACQKYCIWEKECWRKIVRFELRREEGTIPAVSLICRHCKSIIFTVAAKDPKLLKFSLSNLIVALNHICFDKLNKVTLKDEDLARTGKDAVTVKKNFENMQKMER